MIYLLFGALVIAVVLAGAYVSLFVGHRHHDGAGPTGGRAEGERPDVPDDAAGDASTDVPGAERDV